MGKRSIYIFTNSYLPVLGGIQTVASQLATGLRDRGYNVKVVTSLYPRNLKIREKIDGIDVLRLPFQTGRRWLDRPMKCVINSVLTLKMWRSRPEAVYVHFPLAQCDFVRRLKKRFGFRLVTCFHGHDVMRHKGKSIYELEANPKYLAQKALISVSDAVTACSGYLAGEVEKCFNVKDVVAIPNGVDLTRFKKHTVAPPGMGSPFVFGFGRLIWNKGFDILINAFDQSVIPQNWRLYIAGEGPEKVKLQEQIDYLGLGERVKLIGRISPEQVVAYSTRAALNVIPSRMESFGIGALEAMAAKRPVIVTNVGGLAELIDDRYGQLCSPNVASMSDAINKVFERNMDFDFSGIDEYLEMYSVNNMVSNYETVTKF